MTREEAIKILKQIQRLYGGLYATSELKETYNAFDMAIEALSKCAKGGDAKMSPLQKPQTTPMKQSPSDGAALISRADVLALAEKGYIISNSNYKKVCDLINELPSASTQTSGDFISRADALKAIDYRRKTANIDGRIILDEVEDRIRELPSADRPSGEWTYLHGSIGSYMTMNCPFCGETFNNVAEWKYNYCPNCGAEMKGEK